MILLTAATISGVSPGRERGQRVGVGGVGEQPVAEFADGQRRDRREGARSWLSTISRVTSSAS